MINQIKNSNNKITGNTVIETNKIVIDNIGKPILEINDCFILKSVKEKDISKEILIYLYNNLTLTIGEIASLYGVCYSNINKKLKSIPEIKFNKCGRRNRAYGKKVSKEQSAKMSTALKGRAATYYERTPEIREKISNSLKEYYSKHPQNPLPHIKNWQEGKYKNVDFKIGIGGKFYSIKMNKNFCFRSLLELYYLLKLEQDPAVICYNYEPFVIKMDNGHNYTPDFLLNNKTVVELKSKKYVNKVSGVKDKVLYKQSQAKKYCSQNNLEYKIIYDEDIGFESRKMKKFINENLELVNKYHIVFNNPSRVVNK